MDSPVTSEESDAEESSSTNRLALLRQKLAQQTALEAEQEIQLQQQSERVELCLRLTELNLEASGASPVVTDKAVPNVDKVENEVSENLKILRDEYKNRLRGLLDDFENQDMGELEKQLLRGKQIQARARETEEELRRMQDELVASQEEVEGCRVKLAAAKAESAKILSQAGEENQRRLSSLAAIRIDCEGDLQKMQQDLQDLNHEKSLLEIRLKESCDANAALHKMTEDALHQAAASLNDERILHVSQQTTRHLELGPLLLEQEEGAEVSERLRVNILESQVRNSLYTNFLRLTNTIALSATLSTNVLNEVVMEESMKRSSLENMFMKEYIDLVYPASTFHSMDWSLFHNEESAARSKVYLDECMYIHEILHSTYKLFVSTFPNISFIQQKYEEKSLQITIYNTLLNGKELELLELQELGDRDDIMCIEERKRLEIMRVKKCIGTSDVCQFNPNDTADTSNPAIVKLCQEESKSRAEIGFEQTAEYVRIHQLRSQLFSRYQFRSPTSFPSASPKGSEHKPVGRSSPLLRSPTSNATSKALSSVDWEQESVSELMDVITANHSVSNYNSMESESDGQTPVAKQKVSNARRDRSTDGIQIPRDGRRITIPDPEPVRKRKSVASENFSNISYTTKSTLQEEKIIQLLNIHKEEINKDVKKRIRGALRKIKKPEPGMENSSSNNEGSNDSHNQVKTGSYRSQGIRIPVEYVTDQSSSEIDEPARPVYAPPPRLDVHPQRGGVRSQAKAPPVAPSTVKSPAEALPQPRREGKKKDVVSDWFMTMEQSARPKHRVTRESEEREFTLDDFRYNSHTTPKLWGEE